MTIRTLDHLEIEAVSGGIGEIAQTIAQGACDHVFGAPLLAAGLAVAGVVFLVEAPIEAIAHAITD